MKEQNHSGGKVAMNNLDALVGGGFTEKQARALVRTAIDLINSVVNPFIEQMNQRFGAMDRRLDGMDRRLGRMEEQTRTMNNRFESMEKKIDRLQNLLLGSMIGMATLIVSAVVLF